MTAGIYPLKDPQVVGPLRPYWAQAAVDETELGTGVEADVTQKFHDTSDVALAVALGRWQDDALAEAYRRHAGAVYGLAKRVTGQVGVAEDVVQEVFLRLWNEPEKFEPERGSLRSYLLAQCHSRSVERLRSDTSRRYREERAAREIATSSYDIDHEVWDLTVAESIKQAVLGLPLAERKAIELAYFGGHTYREVAGILGEPEGTIKSRIRSGLKRISASLVAGGVSGP